MCYRELVPSANARNRGKEPRVHAVAATISDLTYVYSLMHTGSSFCGCLRGSVASMSN